jgi:hypothetical protein
MIQGLGANFYANGDRYEGSWRNGQRNGHGTQFYANGDIYVGEWLDDMRSGIGTLTKGLKVKFQVFFCFEQHTDFYWSIMF